jgi:outer membrane protein insertion porin family
VAQQFWNDRRRGASLRIGRPFPWFDYTSVFFRYLWESIELSNFSPLYRGVLRNTLWPQITSSLGATIVRNSTDNPFRPTTGSRVSLAADITGGFLGGDVSFQSYEAQLSWYHPLFWKFVLQVSFDTAVLDGLGVNGSVPEYELFRLGGNRRYGVRGYDFFQIVPQGNPLFVGGRYMHILSYEVTVPVAPTIYLLGFLDAGNTWNSFQSADPLDLRKGLGVGIRLELPMLGTVGFDYGYGFDKLFPGWEPHLSLGAGF